MSADLNLNSYKTTLFGSPNHTLIDKLVRFGELERDEQWKKTGAVAIRAFVFAGFLLSNVIALPTASYFSVKYIRSSDFRPGVKVLCFVATAIAAVCWAKFIVNNVNKISEAFINHERNKDLVDALGGIEAVKELPVLNLEFLSKDTQHHYGVDLENVGQHSITRGVDRLGRPMITFKLEDTILPANDGSIFKYVEVLYMETPGKWFFFHRPFNNPRSVESQPVYDFSTISELINGETVQGCKLIKN